MKRILLSLFLVTAFSALAMETEEENVLPDITINENNSEPAADGKKVEKLVKRINKL